MDREHIKREVINYINNNLKSEYLVDRVDIILRLLYDIEKYLDFKNETIDKVIELLQNEAIFH